MRADAVRDWIGGSITASSTTWHDSATPARRAGSKAANKAYEDYRAHGRQKKNGGGWGRHRSLVSRLCEQQDRHMLTPKVSQITAGMAHPVKPKRV
jgi:hypothetical protein